MYAKILGMEQLSENQQSELGQELLRTMFYFGLQMDGIRIEFEK